MWNLKNKTSDYNKDTNSQVQRQTSGYQWREGRGKGQDRDRGLSGTKYSV